MHVSRGSAVVIAVVLVVVFVLVELELVAIKDVVMAMASSNNGSGSSGGQNAGMKQNNDYLLKVFTIIVVFSLNSDYIFHGSNY